MNFVQVTVEFTSDPANVYQAIDISNVSNYDEDDYWKNGVRAPAPTEYAQITLMGDDGIDFLEDSFEDVPCRDISNFPPSGPVTSACFTNGAPLSSGDSKHVTIFSEP